MKKDRYIYPAIFSFAEDGISVEFPDLPGCLTCGDNEEEALKNAKEAMELHLYGMERDNDDIPDATSIQRLHLEQGQIVVMIQTYMPLVRTEQESKAVKKTLTIPRWLNDVAEKNNVNFSSILQQGLKDYLGIHENK
jgi:predicted RNase H-like HicB family nuclease